MLIRFTLTLLLFLSLNFASLTRGSTPTREGYIQTADDVRLYYKVVGSGPDTLVVVHGGPGNSMESIRANLEPLAKRRTVIYYDQRGNGRSDSLTDSARLAIPQHIEDLETIRQHFGLERLTLLGVSWGGLLVGYYATAHPDRVERLVLHSPATPTVGFMHIFMDRLSQRIPPADGSRLQELVQGWAEASDPRAICREFYRLLLPPYFADPGAFTRSHGDLCAGSEDTVRNQRLVNQLIWRSLGEYDIRSPLTAVQAPTLVVHGVQDPIPVESSSTWAASLANGRLLVIDGAGHVPHIEQPEIFFHAVEMFLAGQWPAEAKKVGGSGGDY